MFKSGKVVLLGEPNVGKSSLLNKLVGEPVSAVTPMAGTTREQIRGYRTDDGFQIIFLDTPGMGKGRARTGLDKFMNKSISRAVAEADVICYVLDATAFGRSDIQKIVNLRDKRPIVVAVNKSDKTNYAKLYPKLAGLNALDFVRAIVPVSAVHGENLDALVSEIVKTLPEGTREADTDEYTDRSVRQMCAEILRAQLIKTLSAEIPHGIAVRVTRFTEKSSDIEIDAEIICAKPNHKPIIIGKRGAVLKSVGTAARREMEKLTGRHVRLNTHVLVREGWKDSNSMLDELGYS
jgi:GTP-binding protein Era